MLQARYTSIKAQNCSADPTPLELPSTRGATKSFVVEVKSGVQSEQGYAKGLVGAEDVNRSRQVVMDCDVGRGCEAERGDVNVEEEEEAEEEVVDGSLDAEAVAALGLDDLVRREVHRPMVRAARQRMIPMIANYLSACFFMTSVPSRSSDAL